MRDYFPPLLPGAYYHVYNRGNNRDNIFYRPQNYAYFLDRYKHFVAPWLDTYVYCLLPNHFHLLVRVKEPTHFQHSPYFLRWAEKLGKHQDIPCFENMECLSAQLIPAFISEQFRRFFIGYSKALNKQENRVGSLFQKTLNAFRSRTSGTLASWSCTSTPMRSCTASAMISGNIRTVPILPF